LIGAVLRIHDLGAESLWYDEISSIDQANRDLPSLFFKFHLSPLYFFLLRYWMKLFGMTEVSLRYLSAVSGIGSIFLTYRVGRILFNKRVGIISSVFISLSPFHLFHSQDARHYSLFVFLTLLSMLLFLKILNESFEKKCKLYIFYAIATVLLLYTHLWGIFVVLAQNIFFFLRKHDEKRRWIVAQTVIFVTFFVWFAPFVSFLLKEKEYITACLAWISRPGLYSLIEMFKTFSYGGMHYGRSDFFVRLEEIGFSSALLYIFSFFFVLGAVPSGKKDSQKILFLALWLLLPVLILFISSFIFFPVFVDRYFLFVLPAYYLFVAKGIDKINNNLAKVAMVSFVVILTVPALRFYYKQDLKIRWDAAFDCIERNRKKDDLFIVVPSRHVQMFEYAKIREHTGRGRIRLNIIEDLGIKIHEGGFVYNFRGNDIIGVNSLKQLSRAVDGHIIDNGPDVWLVLSRWARDREGIKEFLGARRQKIRQEFFPGVELLCYRSEELN